MRLRGAAVAVALALSLGAAPACTDEELSEPEPSVRPLPDLSGDAVPIPAAEAGDLTLVGLAPMPDWSLGPTAVTEVEGQIVAVTAEALALDGFPDRRLEHLGGPGPALADGRPTRTSSGGGWLRTGVTLTAGAPGDPETVISASTEAEDQAAIDLLARVLSEVSLPLTEAGAVPGRFIGTLGADGSEAWHVIYEGRRRSPTFTIEEVSPSAQAALRALVHPEPAETIDPRTVPSCCPDGVLEPLRELDGPRPGFVATLTPYSRILVLEGAPGVALRAVSGVGIADDDLIAIAAALESGSQDERAALRESLLQIRRDEQAAEIVAQEQAMGWSVVGRTDFETEAVVLSSGTQPRSFTPGDPRLCAVVALGGETCLSAGELGPGSVAGHPTETMVYVPPEDVAAARVELLDASWPMVEVALDAGADLPERLFVMRIPFMEIPEIWGHPARAELVAVADDGSEAARVSLIPGI